MYKILHRFSLSHEQNGLTALASAQRFKNRVAIIGLLTAN